MWRHSCCRATVLNKPDLFHQAVLIYCRILGFQFRRPSMQHMGVVPGWPMTPCNANLATFKTACIQLMKGSHIWLAQEASKHNDACGWRAERGQVMTLRCGMTSRIILHLTDNITPRQPCNTRAKNERKRFTQRLNNSCAFTNCFAPVWSL